jgi:phospholipid/cholesterol/gamma-HCH transport system substrate-binding protein
MAIKPRLAANLGMVVVITFVAIAWALSQLILAGGFEPPFVVTADFESSGGVFTNQEVAYRGVVVGRVGEMRLNEDGVDIELLIESEWEGRIPADSIAKVQSKSAVGEQFVNLTPPVGAGEETLSDGDLIAREDTQLPVDFQQLLTSLNAVLADVPPKETARLITNLADGIGGREEEIGTILDSLGALSDAFADVAPQQRTLLNNAPVAGRAFLDSKDAFADAIRAADRVFAGIGDEPEELRALLAANDRAAREGIEFLAKHRNSLTRGIAGFADFVSFQLEEIEGVKQSLEHLPEFLHAVEDASTPWTAPDGSHFFRIRIGLIVDNVPASWPCKYKVPPTYERFPHERSVRSPVTSMNCLPPAPDDAVLRSLVAALKDWADDHPVPEPPPEISLTSGGSTFVWPLFGPVTSGFGMRGDRMHTGIDIDADLGDAVNASAPGRVVHVGEYFEYGTTVIVEHADGYSTLYAHLSEAVVAVGDDVDYGDPVGGVGCTGECSGAHLHFEIMVDGVPIDPLELLPAGSLFAPTSFEDRDI